MSDQKSRFCSLVGGAGSNGWACDEGAGGRIVAQSPCAVYSTTALALLSSEIEGTARSTNRPSNSLNSTLSPTFT
jgi:hypothetical protein